MPEKDNFIDFLKELSEYESQCSGVYMLNPSGLAKTEEAASVVNIIIETMGGSYRVNTEPKNLCAEFVLTLPYLEVNGDDWANLQKIFAMASVVAIEPIDGQHFSLIFNIPFLWVRCGGAQTDNQEKGAR